MGQAWSKGPGQASKYLSRQCKPGTKKKINTLNLQPCLNEMDLQESQLYSVEEGEEALTSLGLWHLQLFLCTLRRFYNGVLPPSPSLGRRHNPIAALTPHANKITLITLFTLPRPLLSRTAAQNGTLCKNALLQFWSINPDRLATVLTRLYVELQANSNALQQEEQLKIKYKWKIW